MSKLSPETVTDQSELALLHLFRARLAERLRRPRKYDFTFIADGMLFDSKLFVKDESPKIDLRA